MEATMKPAKYKFTLLKQVIEIISAYLVPKLAKKHRTNELSVTFITFW